MKLEEVKGIIENEFKDYNLVEIKEDDNNYYVFLDKDQEFDTPILSFSKTSDDKGALDRTSNEAFNVIKTAKTIYSNEQGEEENMDQNNKEELKIRKLLKMYGAEDGEIENFMQDLKDFKDDEEDFKEDEKDEEEDFNYLDNDTMEKLKATEQGKDLIMNAPKMAKEELQKAIKEYLTNA